MRRSRLICSVLLMLLDITLASDNSKRAPSGFQGVRGKKSIQDTYPETSIIETPDLEIDKRVPSAGFHGMRGKKLFEEQSDLALDYPKRAPMGFLGMRGKKEMEFPNSATEYDKRAPMGFLGMRGKKENDAFDDELNDYYMDKRAPMGFLGVRGKKEYTPFEEREEKRAPVSGFFGMRGKKEPGRSSFFGMRGKKYPYELRGKFVGVRGKKFSNENALPEDFNTDEFAAYQNNLDLNQLMLLLNQNNNDDLYWEKRKGPSGFLGMRG